MKLWKVQIRDEELTGETLCYTGMAQTAKGAIDKAMELARKECTSCKHLYVDFVSCLGSKDF